MENLVTFGLEPETFRTVVAFITFINLFLVGFMYWQRVQINRACKSIEENHKKTTEIANDIFKTQIFEHYEKISNYDKLTSKNNWYIFNLINLFYARNEDTLEAFKYIGIIWCKRPEDVAKDYMIIAEHYLKLDDTLSKIIEEVKG